MFLRLDFLISGHRTSTNTNDGRRLGRSEGQHYKKNSFRIAVSLKQVIGKGVNSEMMTAALGYRQLVVNMNKYTAL